MKYRVFFNRDCMMYGVQEFKYNQSYQGEGGKWVQVLPPRGLGGRKGQSAYTYYEGVAKRWATELSTKGNN